MAPELHIRQEKIEDIYDVKEELGRGQFAVVKKCISKDKQLPVAAKFVKVKKTKVSRNGLSREMIEREAGILSMLDHSHVLKLHDVFDLGIEMCLVLELLSGGELFDKISEQEFLTEAEAGCYMKQVLEGIAYLHKKFIVHLDIKPENIVLKDKQKSDIKLVDFGLAQVIKPGDEVREMMGTPEFVAPEVVNFDCIGLYTDMWAIGVLAYILLSGCSPFLGDDNQETYANIVAIDYHFDEEYFDAISDDAKLFVEELLKKNPKKRNTAEDCLDHPWIRSMASPRSRLESSVIQTARFKAFQARRRWQQSFQKMKAITRFSRFLKIRASSAEEPKLEVFIPPVVDVPKENSKNAPDAVIHEEPAKNTKEEESEEKEETSNTAETKQLENITNEKASTGVTKSLLSIPTIPDIVTDDVDQEIPNRTPTGTPNMKRRYSRSESPVHYTELLNLIVQNEGQNIKQTTNDDATEVSKETMNETINDDDDVVGKTVKEIKEDVDKKSTEFPEPKIEELLTSTVNVEIDMPRLLVVSEVDSTASVEKELVERYEPDERDDEVTSALTEEAPGFKPVKMTLEKNLEPSPANDKDLEMCVSTDEKNMESQYVHEEDEAEEGTKDSVEITKVIENENEMEENVCVIVAHDESFEESEKDTDKSAKEEITEITSTIGKENSTITTAALFEENVIQQSNFQDCKIVEKITGEEENMDKIKEPVFPCEHNLENDNVVSDLSNVKAFDIRDTKGCRITGRKSVVYHDGKQEKKDVKQPSISLDEKRRSFILGEQSQVVSADTDEQEFQVIADEKPLIDEDTRKDESNNTAEEKLENGQNKKVDADQKTQANRVGLDENANVNNAIVANQTKLSLNNTYDNNHKTPLVDGKKKKKKIGKGCACMVM